MLHSNMLFIICCMLEVCHRLYCMCNQSAALSVLGINIGTFLQLTLAPLSHHTGVDVNGSDAVYTTPLQVAAASGHETLVQLLVQRGARLDEANMYGWTPLMHAARHGHVGVVRLLLQRGADVSRSNRLGTSRRRSLLACVVTGVSFLDV